MHYSEAEQLVSNCAKKVQCMLKHIRQLKMEKIGHVSNQH